MGWRELFWKIVQQLCRVLWRMRSPVANLKLGSYVDQPYVLLGARKLLRKSLIYPVHYILFIPPPWVWLGLLSTFVLTPLFLIFTEEDPDIVPEDVE